MGAPWRPPHPAGGPHAEEAPSAVHRRSDHRPPGADRRRLGPARRRIRAGDAAIGRSRTREGARRRRRPRSARWAHVPRAQALGLAEPRRADGSEVPEVPRRVRDAGLDHAAGLQARLRHDPPEQRARHRGEPDRPLAHRGQLERLRLLLRRLLHVVRRGADLDAGQHVGRGRQADRERSGHRLRSRVRQRDPRVAELPHQQGRPREGRRRGRLHLEGRGHHVGPARRGPDTDRGTTSRRRRSSTTRNGSSSTRTRRRRSTDAPTSRGRGS